MTATIAPNHALPEVADTGCKQGGPSCLECRLKLCKYDTARYTGRMRQADARAVERQTREQLRNLKRASALVKLYHPPTFAVPGRVDSRGGNEVD